MATNGEGDTTGLGAPEGFDPAVPPDPKDRRTLWIVLSAIAGFVALLAIWGLRSSVPVPDVTGLAQEEATFALEAVGLTVGQTTLEPTLDVAPGTVTGQSPAPAESAREGESVDLVVASIPDATVPDVVGMTSSEAEAELAQAGLLVGEVEAVYSDEAPAGTVLAQSPEGGTEASIASAVALDISAGPEQGAVPDVTGLASVDAIDVLESAGFEVDEDKQTSADVPAGSVISQVPAAGTVAVTGSTVTITVSTGAPAAVEPAPPAADEDEEAEAPTTPETPATPETPPVSKPEPEPEPSATEVPDLIGMGVLKAFMALRQADLQFAIAWGPTDDNYLNVIAQDPGAGAGVDPGTVVTVTIGLPSFLFDGVQVQPLPSEPPGGAEGSGDTTDGAGSGS